MESDNSWEGISLEDARSLLPRMVRREISQLDTVKAGRKDGSGVMLFIDISGFSSLATKLQARHEGMDVLSAMLNQHLTDMITIIHQNSGDVLTFSGDALLAVWQGLDIFSINMATRCALRLQKHEYSFDDPSIETMHIHIGISLGSFSVVILGGRGATALGKWRYAVLGTAVHKAARGLDLAGKGEIVITEEVRDQLTLEHTIEDADVSPTYFLLKSITHIPRMRRRDCVESQLSTNAIGSFSFDTVAWCLMRRALGEIRTISSVFIKLSSLNELPLDTAIEKLQLVVVAVQKALASVEGVLNKVTIDDKGWVILCLFGLPLHTHEDIADRAVRFSIKMSGKLSKLTGRVFIGVSRAKVYCGLTGCTARREYTALGDGVNIGARLMCKADALNKESVIYIDEETVASCTSSKRLGVMFTPVAPEGLSLKGVSVAIPVYQIEQYDPSDQAMSLVALEGISSDEMVSSRHDGSLDSASSGSFQRLNLARTASLLSSKAAKSLQRSRMKQSADSVFSDDSLNSRGSRGLSSRSSGQSDGSRKSPRFPMNATPRNKLFASPRNDTKQLKMSIKSGNSVSSCMLESPESRPQVVPGTKQKIFGRGIEVSILMSFMQGILHKKSCHGPITEQHKIVNFIGEAQMGKSMLLEVAESIATYNGLHPVRIAGSESEEFVPYFAVVPLVTHFTETMSVQFIEMSFVPELRKHLPLLHYVIRVPGLPTPTEEHKNMESAHKVSLLNQVLRAWVRRFHGDRTLLIIDDVQWLDELTISFILDYLNNGGKAVIATRPQNRIELNQSLQHDISESSISTDHGLTEPGFVEVGKKHASDFLVLLNDEIVVYKSVLQSFSKAVLEGLLNFVFGSQNCDPTLVSTIYCKSDARPGFAMQITTALKFASLIEIKDKVVVPVRRVSYFQEFIVHTVPSIEAHVMKRFDLLTGHERLVASMLSAITCCTHQVLQECLDAYGSYKIVSEAVEKLVRSDLVKRTNGKLSYALNLARDIIYYSCLGKDKQLLHSAVVRVIYNMADYTDDEVIAHVEACSLPRSEILTLFNEHYERSLEGQNIQGCLSALIRVPFDEVSEACDLRKLRIAGFWNEQGNTTNARTAMQRLAVKKASFHPPRKHLCCFPARKPAISVRTAIKLQYQLLHMELDLWECDCDSAKSRLEQIKCIAKSHILDMSCLFRASDLVFGKKPCTEWDISYPLTIIAGCGSWGCIGLFDKWITNECPAMSPLPAAWMENGNKQKGKYGPADFWRPSTKSLALNLHKLLRVLIGEPFDRDTTEQPKWDYYESLLQCANVELNFMDTNRILRLGFEGKVAWSDDKPFAGGECDDVITHGLAACLKACHLAQGGGICNVQATFAQVKNTMKVATPYQGLILWLFLDALLASQRKQAGYNESSWSPVSGSETKVSSEYSSSNLTDELCSVIAECFEAFRTLASLFPPLTLAYNFMKGEAADEGESRRFYAEVIKSAFRLGAPNCCLAWRARARILTRSPSDETGLAVMCMHSSVYKPSLGSNLLASLMLKEARFKPCLRSPEARDLELKFCSFSGSASKVSQ